MLVPFKRKLRILLLKWHRGLGLIAALFAIFLVVTGIPLNHGNDLLLDKTPIPSSLLSWYGIQVEIPQEGFKLGDRWTVSAQQQLFLDSQNIGSCRDQLAGAVATDEGLFIACGRQVYFLTNEGEVIETAELRFAVGSVGSNSGNVYLKLNKQAVNFDLYEFEVGEVVITEDKIKWSIPDFLPSAISDAIADQIIVEDMTWERFLLDLHSGRMFGSWGVWFVDLIGIAILVLAVSGVWLRLARPKAKHH
ncbi:MAG: PepSY domain-containing protein [Pseudomonadales bacterium]|nr:PepSY domain-containing protein [Pseudomonadales bacterium]